MRKGALLNWGRCPKPPGFNALSPGLLAQRLFCILGTMQTVFQFDHGYGREDDFGSPDAQLIAIGGWSKRAHGMPTISAFYEILIRMFLTITRHPISAPDRVNSKRRLKSPPWRFWKVSCRAGL